MPDVFYSCHLFAGVASRHGGDPDCRRGRGARHKEVFHRGGTIVLLLCSFAFLGEGASEVGEEFFDDAEAGVAGHGESEADGTVAEGALTLRLPETGEEGCGGNASELGDGDVAAGVIVAGKHAAGKRVFGAAPNALLAGVEVAVVFMQCATEAEGDGALNGVLALDIQEAFAVARSSLAPLWRLVLPLINSSGESRLEKTQRVHHGFEVEVRAFGLGEGAEVAGFVGSGHVEVVEEVVDTLVGGGGFWERCGLSLSRQERGGEQKRDPDAA